MYGCLTSAKYHSYADLMEVVATQNPATKEISRTWTVTDTFLCDAQSIKSDGASETSSNKKFGKEYSEEQRIKIVSKKKLNKRQRITNLTDKNGNLITTKNRYNENVYVPIPNVVPNKIAYATGEGLAGPVDLMWDKYRGVWTSHDIVTGFAASNMRPFDDGYIYINMSGVKTTRTLFIKNFSTKKIYAGQSVVACYSVNDARWIVRGEQIKIKFDDGILNLIKNY